jgi:hypothetical protein
VLVRHLIDDRRQQGTVDRQERERERARRGNRRLLTVKGQRGSYTYWTLILSTPDSTLLNKLAARCIFVPYSPARRRLLRGKLFPKFDG